MGYAHYTNKSGRECGYGISATCDHPGCDTEIDRGYAYLCGYTHPLRDEGPGCGGYFCEKHLGWVRETLDGFCVSLCPKCKKDPAMEKYLKPDDGRPPNPPPPDHEGVRR